MVTKLLSGQEMLYNINQRGIRSSYGSCALHFESLREACMPSLESFGPMMTKLRSGQGKQDDAAADDEAAADQSKHYMSHSQATHKRNKVDVWFLCTALSVIAINIHIKL